MTREKSLWQLQVERNPNHSQWYIDRFKAMAANGDDIWGEARLVDALSPRHAKILDAGCGPGRIGARLQELGHEVIGVDIDPTLIAEAQRVSPAATWIAADLTDLQVALKDSAPQTGENGFDTVVCAGNVMTFLAPSTRLPVLAGLREVLAPQGRALIGFGAGRGYEFRQFMQDARSVGFELQQTYSTWDARPWHAESDFLVAVLGLEA